MFSKSIVVVCSVVFANNAMAGDAVSNPGTVKPTVNEFGFYGTTGDKTDDEVFPECGFDGDDDGKTDTADTACTSATDMSETKTGDQALTSFSTTVDAAGNFALPKGQALFYVDGMSNDLDYDLTLKYTV